MVRTGSKASAAWLLSFLLLGGCSAISDFGGEGLKPADGASDSDASVADAGAMDGGQDGGGQSGSDAGVDGGGGGGDCTPNPDPSNEVCTEICPEICNNQDDDCDLRIDEDEADDHCELDHATATCERGVCLVVECTTGFRDCDQNPKNGCEASDDDPENCGQCGNACTYPNGVTACENNACKRVACQPGFGDCDANPNDCETSLSTLTNCAACGVSCEPGDHAVATCEQGFCGIESCTEDQGMFGDCNTVPGDGCEEPLDTLVSCGMCGDACDFPGSTDACYDGTCVAEACASGYAQCDGNPLNGCESLSSSQDCGACDSRCDATLPNVSSGTCGNQTCTPVCEDGFADCDNDPWNGCEVSTKTLTDCGGCGVACSIANATATCATSSCRVETCAQGYDDCDDDKLDCETSLDSLTDCGACGAPCGGVSCQGGVCSNASCTAPMADCDGDSTCETNTATSPSHCGACNSACAFDVGTMPHATLAGCTLGACQIQCDAGYADCNGDYSDGCERSIRTLTDCGACNAACSIQHAAATCGTGSCAVASCDVDWGDCDANPATCETSLNTTQSCGACNTSCNLPNAVASCGGTPGARSCQLSTCTQSYYDNCDGTAANGCEIDKRTNENHCGACNNDCSSHPNVASATCGSSQCAYTCSAGYANCSSSPGCETQANTLSNCGGCGVTCARANASVTCMAGSCAIVACNSGFDDCDGNPDNGCEALTTVDNCGQCGKVCLPANATGVCTTGSCQIMACAAGWADCNQDPSDGCERNTAAPPAGLGPCAPDSNCTKVSPGAGQNDYFFCNNQRSWMEARNRCRLQLLGDLVRINDAPENTLVKNGLAGDAWTGASDQTTEGQWRWPDGVQFWMGASLGSAVGGLYSNWNTGEPNDGGGSEDCGSFVQSSGKWSDAACGTALRFVCEVQADLCPSDPNKAVPGQCGCGTPDTDSDGDGTANCIDMCPNDSGKVSPGVCGCGVRDTDSDGDGVLDCFDQCPSVPDTDTDADGEPDCNDTCPYDPTTFKDPVCSYAYTPSNFDPSRLFSASSPDVVADCGQTITLDTDSDKDVQICASVATPVVQTQSNGTEIWVLPMRTLILESGTVLRFKGTRPAVIAVSNDAYVNGELDAGAQGDSPGAGGSLCGKSGSGAGGSSAHDGVADQGDGGGGGGGFGSLGASGGDGNKGSAGGTGGVANGNTTLVPLRGGCSGGASTSGGNASPGAGGGALELSVAGRLEITSKARIAAAGGGGLPGTLAEDGGSGGGSGGALLIEAYVLSLDPSAWITANGGGGASGNATGSVNGAPGTDGLDNNTARAPGGPGGSGGGSGGAGAALAGGALPGADGTCVGAVLCLNYGAGGGGGGGGVGRIRVNTQDPKCDVPTARISPAASVFCP